MTATSPAATARLGDAVSTTSPLSLTLMPLAFSLPMPRGPVSSSGKVAGGNVEPVLLVPGGRMSKLSGLPDWLMRTKFVPGTDARVI